MAARPIPLSADLKAKGISPAAWKGLTNEQRREVIKQSGTISREARGKGAPAGTPAARERTQRAAARARRFAAVPPSRRTSYWHQYDKGSEGAEFWALYTVIA